MTISPLERAIEEFATQLARWRTTRGLSKRALAQAMRFDPSYVSHVERRRHRPTEDFARRAENALEAGGAIWSSYATYEAVRQSVPAAVLAVPGPRREMGGWSVPGVGLIVEREHAAIGLRHDVYHIVVRRQLHNAGSEPIVRYPVRIRVDRFPGHPRRSARTHHGAPLTWAELGFSARRLGSVTHDGAGGSEDVDVMAWRPTHDADATKELWLRFGNDDRQFPLYPGQRTTIEYAYQVSSAKWGPWFERTIAMPTRELHVQLDFPADTQVAVWGTMSSLSAEGAPLATPIEVAQDADKLRFTWSVRSPALCAAYRFEWRFRD